MNESTSSKLANTKHYKRLLANHQSVLINHINHNTDMKPKLIQAILKMYAMRLDAKNIKYYYARSMKLFISALVLDKLDIIKDYESYKTLEDA